MRHQARVLAIAIAPDGSVLATGSADGTVRVWEPSTGLPIGPMLHQDGAVRALAFRPDGRMLITGGADKVAKLADVPAPLTGSPASIAVSTRLWTGMVLDHEDEIRLLGGRAWHEVEQRGQRAD